MIWHMKRLKDVTREYTVHAAPGIGRLIHEEGTEEDDRKTSAFLFGKYGGDITTLKVENVNGRDLKTPDALWNGMYWEYKNISTETSIERRIKLAWRQLKESAERKGIVGASVGIVINISNKKQILEETIRIIEEQFEKKILYPADLIIRDGDKIIKIIRK